MNFLDNLKKTVLGYSTYRQQREPKWRRNFTTKVLTILISGLTIAFATEDTMRTNHYLSLAQIKMTLAMIASTLLVSILFDFFRYAQRDRN